MATLSRSSPRAVERRRHRRVGVTWTVTLEDDRGFTSAGDMMVFGPFGAKVRLATADPPLSHGSIVHLGFAPPGSATSMGLKGMVWRTDPDGVVIVFVDLSPQEFDRLQGLVDSLLNVPV